MSAAGPPAVFEPVLQRLAADAASYVGAPSVRLTATRAIERPGSHVLRVAVHGQDDGTTLCHLFVKVFKPKRIEGGIEAMRARVARDHRTTRETSVAMASHDDLGVVPAVACYPDLLAIVTEEVTGPTLLDYLHQQVAWFPSTRRLDAVHQTMQRLGRWIRVFQSIDVPEDTVRLDDLRAYIDHRLQRLVHHGRGRFTADDRERVLRHIQMLGEQIPADDLRSVPVHSDLALGNVLVAGSRVVVLDFAMTKAGSKLHDLTRLCLQVDLLAIKPQMRASVVGALRESVMEGFDPALTTDHALFRLLTLLHRVNNLTTCYVRRAPLPGALYEKVVRNKHEQWIAGELARGAG